MKARKIREYILSRADWVDKERTVDTFKHGDPETEVKAAAVTWMLTMSVIDEVKSLGANLVITHEPTFYTHTDDVEQVKNDPVYLAKRERLDEAALTVLRIHDSWDTWPDIGIVGSLAALLELTELDARDRGRKVYGMKGPCRLDAFACLVRDRLGMDAVGMMGDGERRIRRVSLACGAMGGLDSMRKFLSLRPDVIVAGELSHWQDVRFLEDNGCSLVLTDHAASENPGMRSLAEFVQRQFGIPAHFIEVGPPLRTMAR